MNSAVRSLTASWTWTTVDVLNHLWQSTVVALAVLAMLRLGRGLSAHTRRALGWMALVKFALPAIFFVQAFARLAAAPVRWVETGALARPMTLPAFIVTTSAGDTAARISAGALVTFVWLTVFAGLFISWFVRGRILQRQILAETRPVAPALERGIAAAAEHAGLAQPPRCLAVGDERTPGVLGIFAPVVILPRGFEATLTSAELESILIHEFVHVRRRDNLWSAVQAFFVSLFWFHPVVWLLNRRLAIETEQSCDERVLEITGDPDAYAGGIVKAVRHALGVAQPGLIGATTPPVIARIKNIFAHNARPDRPFARGAVLVGGGLLLALSGYTGSFAAQPPAPAAPAPVAAPAATAPAAKKPEATLSVDFPDEDISQIIRNVADLFQLNVIMPATLRGKTTIKLRDVTWRQIFTAVLDPAGYEFVEKDNVVRIVTKESRDDETTTTVVFRINHAKAVDLLPTIKVLVDPAKGQIVVDPRSNSLIVSERPTRMNLIRPLIDQLDRDGAGVGTETKK